MTAWPELLSELARMPEELEHVLRLIAADRLTWKPAEWGGAPGETFSALEHVCHLRDIERDGYQVRVRRLLDEESPSLLSLDGYEIARQRQYERADVGRVLAEFRGARAETLERLQGLREEQLDRCGDFAEYGTLTLRALVHYLRSHDLQHLAGLQWLAGKIASV